MFSKFSAIIWLLSTVNLLTAIEHLSIGRIVGGQDIDISQAKFAVQLIIQNHKTCGGSLVSAQHVVTTAHCVHQIKPIDIMVIGGVSSLIEGGIHQTVNEVYTPENPTLNIAILRLSAPLKGANIQAILLCSTQWKEGDLVDVYGWGPTDEMEKNHSNRLFKNLKKKNMPERHLQKVQVPIMSHKKCCKHFATKNITEGYFCAGVFGKEKYSTGGDCGGSVVFNDSLCGVTSCGGSSAHIGLYVDIKFVASFLDESMCKA